MADGSPAFLGVERSLCGRRWRQRVGDDRAGLALAQQLHVPEIVGRLLASRGVGAAAADRFLNPTLRDDLPDPSHLKDMDRAVERLARAITGGEVIAVFGDYDVDGATASALLQRFLAAVGARARVYIPDRQREGYGPNAPALLRLMQEGAGVVVTVDCGTAAHQPLAAAQAAGLDVIVIDHHIAEPQLPPAYAIVNPNRVDETSPHGVLAAVGLAFLLVVGVNRALRQSGWYERVPAPDLVQWLDLVALGTICDVVPLIGINRTLVAQGLKVLRRRSNPGLAALADVAGVGERLDAYHAGFILGPRVNAGGRVGQADLGAQLLASDDPAAVLAIARQLDALNGERRELEARVLAQAIDQVESGDRNAPLVFAAGEGWHAGVIGIVASRLKERYNRPACVIAMADGVGKGSGRSVSGLALGQTIIAARQAGLLLNGGGHAMAAGFTIALSHLGAFRSFLVERAAMALGSEALMPELGIDGALAAGAAGLELVELVERLGPFGAGNAEPRFALPSLRLLRADVVGAQHVRCVLGDGAGSVRLKAIAFRCLEGELGPALLQGQGTTFHVAGHLRPDNWQGRSGIQLMIDDAARTAG
jgi:single-stranded-DNA-specific exonuclease